MAEKLTIHRALSELKAIDSRIEKAIADTVVSAIHQKNKPIGGHLPVDEFETRAKASFNSANDLIKRKTLIKTRIVESNSRTIIKIGEKIMTVAEAIIEKLNIKLKRQFIETIKTRHKGVLAKLSENNQLVEKNCQAILEHTFGKDQTKVNPDDLKNTQVPFMELHTFHLSDPLKIDEKVKKMEDELIQFETEIDATLSESNAVTTIEF